MSSPLLVFDFDGVLCDSLEECWRSSYKAYEKIFGSYEQNDGAKEMFQTLRPFVRSGEDYLVIHRLLHTGRSASTQTAFDAMRAEFAADLPAWKAALHAERAFLLATDPEQWLSWNPLFPGVSTFLRSMPIERFHILSTKPADLIKRILAHHDVAVNPERITHSGAHDKIQQLHNLLNRYRLPPSAVTFVEDQVEYLIEAQSLGVGLFLVSWGYHSEAERGRAREAGIPLLNSLSYLP